MKTIITTLAALMLATSVTAESLTVVNPGSEEGVFRQILTEISKDTEHNFIQANNPVTAYTYFDNNNILTVWSSEWPGNAKIISPEITEENIVALMSYETLICSREFDSLESMVGNEVKIATWGSEPVARFLAALEIELGVKFVVVPYDGSGATTKGYIGGDASTVFTIQSKQTALEEDANTSCFAFSANGDLPFRFVDAIITINAETTTTQQLTSVVNSLKDTEQWNTLFSGSTTYTDGDLIRIFREAVNNFSE